MKKSLLIMLIIVLLDQVTKYLAKTGAILFDTKFLAFNLVTNTGSAFGMLKGMNFWLIWIYLIVLGFIVYFYASAQEKEKIPLLLITAGLLGNLIDRVLLGYVVDFIDLKFWPVFNIADSAICIGVFLLLIIEFQNSSISSKPDK